MSKIRVRVAVFAALSILAWPIRAHGPAVPSAHLAGLPDSARGAAATVDAFHAALHRGDTRSAANLLADDAIIYEEGGAERSKAEYAEHHLPADATFSKAVHSTVTRRSGHSAGMLAWIASEGRTTGVYKGKSLDRVSAETMVLRRVGRAWKIVHVHWSSAAKQ